MFQKVALLKLLENFPFNQSYRLFKGVLKILENVQERLFYGFMEFLYSKLQAFKLQPLNLEKSQEGL